MQSLKKITMAVLLTLALILWMPKSALAFKVPIHEAITREALAATQPVINNEKLQFSQRAIQQIVDANKDTDQPVNQADTEKHFDGEDFLGGSKRLIRLKERSITKVIDSDPEASSARKDLGGALHTLQDFYAHSNWVEMGHSSPNINTKLGREEFSGADKNTPTCPQDPSTLGGAGLNQLTSGYFLISQGLCGVPTGKCRHGVPVLCPTGLNKDDDSRQGFSNARALAVDATKEFLNQIFSDSRMVGNATATKELLGIN
ncbi:MAG: HET-C-related protein [Aulosira sp. ZfuVER01]|nr:HET-C-related protein [Aulosira sp. ZfuVER01]MDZ7997413.1 HET-C-related protein [Aulosira sp. DedVER01a]MDZ8054558.1 HET-C-related protein [Aulosira sp. ZfuCHP01]